MTKSAGSANGTAFAAGFQSPGLLETLRWLHIAQSTLCVTQERRLVRIAKIFKWDEPPGAHSRLTWQIMKRDARTVAEELLILRCQQGDRQAPAQLVHHWHEMFKVHAWRLLRDPDGVAEVLQETWTGIFRGMHRLKDPSRFRSWAYRALTHKCADWIRSRQRERQRLAGAANQAAVDNEHSRENPELARLREALDALPSEQRALLAMVYNDGFSLTEIAEVLEIPAGTVKSRLFTLRQQLKQELERNES